MLPSSSLTFVLRPAAATSPGPKPEPLPSPQQPARAAMSCGHLLRECEAVAHAPYCLDIAWRGWISLDLLPQPPDVNIQGAGIAQPISAPNLVEQGFASHDL